MFDQVPQTTDLILDKTLESVHGFAQQPVHG